MEQQTFESNFEFGKFMINYPVRVLLPLAVSVVLTFTGFSAYFGQGLAESPYHGDNRVLLAMAIMYVVCAVPVLWTLSSYIAKVKTKILFRYQFLDVQWETNEPNKKARIMKYSFPVRPEGKTLVTCDDIEALYEHAVQGLFDQPTWSIVTIERKEKYGKEYHHDETDKGIHSVHVDVEVDVRRGGKDDPFIIYQVLCEFFRENGKDKYYKYYTYPQEVHVQYKREGAPVTEEPSAEELDAVVRA